LRAIGAVSMAHGVLSALSLWDVIQARDIKLICKCHTASHSNIHTEPRCSPYWACELSFPAQHLTDNVPLFCGTRCAEPGPCPTLSNL